MTDTNAYDVPHLSKQSAEYIKEQLSGDRQVAGGLLSDPAVVRSESYLLGFLAGLGYSRQVIDIIIQNQESAAEESDTMLRDINEMDVTQSYLNM